VQRVSPVFRLDITASLDDVDVMGHVSNLVYIRWVIEIAEAHSAAVGWNFDAYQELGGAFVVRRHEVDYLRPAFAGDAIALETWVESWKAASSIRCTTVLGADGTALARGRTQWAFVDMERGRPVRIPAALREAFAGPPSEAARVDSGSRP
jgi:acyl-CoA thioester hydrolase